MLLYWKHNPGPVWTYKKPTNFKNIYSPIKSNPTQSAENRKAILPLWLKIPSISILLREWAMQSMELGTRPSWAGERSVVRTRHQSGLSWGRSNSSTVWPLRTVNSDPLLAMKSWMTTVSSDPPDNCGGRHKCHNKKKNNRIYLW